MTETFHPRRLVNEGFSKGEGKIASQHNVMIEYGDLTFFLISVVCILTVLDISRDRSNEIFTSPPLSGVDQFVEAFHASTQHLEALLRRVESAVADVTSSAETAPQFGVDDAVRACAESVAKAQESVNMDRSSFEKEIESSTTSFLNDLRSRAAARPIAPVPQSPSDILARQQVISAMENEYPSEAVDEVPGPHYVAPPDPLDDLTPNERVKRQAKAVKDAFQHSWKGYTTYAMGMDELQPRSRSGKNWNEMEGPSNGVGLTVLDSITTMHVMGLRVELAEALEFIKTRLASTPE
ncbi:mannosyl-oligosaccharide alpha-1,2-mannosidase, putative [Bodo saltans]|uniref:alpha-1,2-Mannosidase n=1 Tax=Bodo saltans TaxID=75058 RepID=A0A0S4IZD4_BODSA|nr:mannosyl-oligosaccharide alpha-1,2-mannosidase, putative [Bodo saltans]|eukprot:CUG30980.1 mannosyl-oligosaccharide alpha-1,2-mannosidase, putative [Bodo saltans]